MKVGDEHFGYRCRYPTKRGLRVLCRCISDVPSLHRATPVPCSQSNLLRAKRTATLILIPVVYHTIVWLYLRLMFRQALNLGEGTNYYTVVIAALIEVKLLGMHGEAAGLNRSGELGEVLLVRQGFFVGWGLLHTKLLGGSGGLVLRIVVRGWGPGTRCHIFVFVKLAIGALRRAFPL